MLILLAPSNVKYRMTYHIGTTKTDDVYTFGGYNATLGSATYSNLQYASNLSRGFICTYDKSEYADGLVLALINSGKKGYLSYVNFSSVAGNSNYTTELKQSRASGQLIIAYTKNDCDLISNRMYLVESQQIPSRAFSSFSYGWKDVTPVQIRIEYDRLWINGTDRFVTGSNKVCTANSATGEASLPIVWVYRC